MKKLAILLLIVISGFTKSVAQSMLKVSLADRSVINVSVDGRYFNKSGQSVTVGDLPPGRHRLQIYGISQDRRGRAREEVIYEGKVRTSTGSITIVVYDANTDNIDVQDQDMGNYTIPQQNGSVNNGNYPNNNAYNNQDNRYDNNNYNNNGPAASPAGSLTDDKISKLKDAVAAKATDLQKSDALKDALKNETFTTDQVSVMMGWLIFDETKVAFAEWAYSNTVDKNNFYNLENQFSYKNSQDDLDKFLQQHK